MRIGPIEYHDIGGLLFKPSGVAQARKFGSALIYERSPAIRNMLEELLAELGVEIHCASNDNRCAGTNERTVQNRELVRLRLRLGSSFSRRRDSIGPRAEFARTSCPVIRGNDDRFFGTPEHDLIFIDANLAVDWRALAEAKPPATALIAIGGIADYPRILQAMANGADDYLVKPFDRTILHSKLICFGYGG